MNVTQPTQSDLSGSMLSSQQQTSIELNQKLFAKFEEACQAFECAKTLTEKKVSFFFLLFLTYLTQKMIKFIPLKTKSPATEHETERLLERRSHLKMP